MLDPEGAREAALRTVGTSFLRVRPLLAFPLIAATLITLTVTDTPAPQRILAYAGFGTVGAFFVSETVRHRSRPASGPQLFASLVFTLVGIGFGCAITGGTASPLLPIALAPVGVAFAAFGDDRRSRVMLALALASALGLALLPPPFPALATGPTRFLAALALAIAALLLRSGVARIADAFVTTRAELSATRDTLLAQTVERTTQLEELGARVAHEVKNPLSAVKGLVELVAEDAPSPRARERLDVARGEIDRIESILRDYLSFARPLGHFEARETDLGDVARSVAALLEARAAVAGVTLVADGPALRRPIDPERLKEAVLNLALNALAATPRGGRVVLGWGPNDGGFELTVTDDGSGMDDEVRAKVGTAFFTRRPGGVGLGVALAKRAVELHGGTLTFAARPEGRGTTVTVACPAPR